jgi:hypothetical protein
VPGSSRTTDQGTGVRASAVSAAAPGPSQGSSTTASPGAVALTVVTPSVEVFSVQFSVFGLIACLNTEN